MELAANRKRNVELSFMVAYIGNSDSYKNIPYGLRDFVIWWHSYISEL